MNTNAIHWFFFSNRPCPIFIFQDFFLLLKFFLLRNRIHYVRMPSFLQEELSQVYSSQSFLVQLILCQSLILVLITLSTIDWESRRKIALLPHSDRTKSSSLSGLWLTKLRNKPNFLPSAAIVRNSSLTKDSCRERGLAGMKLCVSSIFVFAYF